MIHFPLNNVELEYKLRDELFQQMGNSKMILSNISDLKNYSFNIIKDINKFNWREEAKINVLRQQFINIPKPINLIESTMRRQGKPISFEKH